MQVPLSHGVENLRSVSWNSVECGILLLVVTQYTLVGVKFSLIIEEGGHCF